MNSSITQTSWYEQTAWAIESDTVRVVVVPDLGAKLVSLFDKRTGQEWLAGPGSRSVRKIAYGANFIDQDLSGWDEMFPTISACPYPMPGDYLGAWLPDHGEVWPLPWHKLADDSGNLSFAVQGIALPYRLVRRLYLTEENTLIMAYEVENQGQEVMPYLWSAHPQFLSGESAVVILPPEVKEVCNVLPAEWGCGEPEERIAWPEYKSAAGPVRMDYVGSSTLKKARKYFVLPETPISWAGLLRELSGDWLRLDWDPARVPYLGVWIDEGFISQESVAALEPMTGFYDSLAVAWEKNLVTILQPGEVHTWQLAVTLGTGAESFTPQ